MNIKKISEFLRESISNEEIIDYFPDYNDSNSLKIEDGWIVEDRFVHKKDYISKSDLNKTRKAKLVSIEFGRFNDVSINIGRSQETMPLSAISEINKAFGDINRFREITDQEITFSLSTITDYTLKSKVICLSILIPLDFVKNEDLNSDVVNGFLSDIKKFLDTTPELGKKRKKLINNWLEMKFTNWRDCLGFGDEIIKMNNNGSRWEELNKIGERIRKSGWEVIQAGGDKQLVLKLKKI